MFDEPLASRAARFWFNVVVNDETGCWVYGIGNSYGRVNWGQSTRYAHHVAWFLTTDQWPADELLHHCDNPPCVNPIHLFEGSHGDNMRDARDKGRLRMPASRPGILNTAARLTEREVLAIREALDCGWKQTDLERYLGGDQTSISLIARGKTWRTLSTE